jgi:NADPH-dependent 7-cyano-7-deazaguanine reductase QueF-like protein
MKAFMWLMSWLPFMMIFLWALYELSKLIERGELALALSTLLP